MNLFNNKWLTPISDTDLINWVEYGITMEDAGFDPLRKSYVSAPYKTYRNVPRQVFITFGLGF